ncbi:hypothetical protein [Desulfococcus multivorans]|uniref:hypothetical protein n=1 Tax=Desulfococcus multivorans TaxID=897 RepID=UPI00041750C1|nr:hypothetical protein [Desulfococcus multivorans]AOY59253.1 uncharacterized protein Dmul_24810 [Desulfococcus multivorans]AQV01475.1 hypothetical protein B2D07_12390 [Desulfococcus multivorans]
MATISLYDLEIGIEAFKLTFIADIKNLSRFDVQFSEQDLADNAGLLHLARFAEKLGLDKLM